MSQWSPTHNLDDTGSLHGAQLRLWTSVFLVTSPKGWLWLSHRCCWVSWGESQRVSTYHTSACYTCMPLFHWPWLTSGPSQILWWFTEGHGYNWTAYLDSFGTYWSQTCPLNPLIVLCTLRCQVTLVRIALQILIHHSRKEAPPHHLNF